MCFTSLCVRVCVCVYIHICIYICTYVCVYIRIYTQTYVCMCIYTHIYFLICLLQVCNLSFSLVSMKCLKKLKIIFLFKCTFCQMALYCVCVVPKQYTIPLFLRSVYDLLVVFCVSCTVKSLYKCQRPHLSSGTHALFSIFCCLMKKRKKKELKWRLRRLEVRGGTVKQTPLNNC